jgi:hypothetical protein
MSEERFVVVTTAHRGVFAGVVVSWEPEHKRAVLRDARNCLYWSADVKGVVGLVAQGPSAGCRIGPAAPQIELLDVTAVLDCTAQARARWEAAPWSS